MGLLNMIFGKKPEQKSDGRGAGPEPTTGGVAGERDVPQAAGSAAQPQTLDERISKVVGKVVEVMREHAPCGPFHVAFEIPASQNEGHFIFEQTRPGDWQLRIGAMRVGTDMLVSHYLCHGDEEKVLGYLARPDLAEMLVRSVKQLSGSVDDKM